MVKETGGAVAIVLLIAGAAGAQDAPAAQRPPEPPVESSSGVTPTPAAALPSTQVAAPEAQKRPVPEVRVLTPTAMREQMLVFSSALNQSVRNGAANLQKRVRQTLPDARLAFSGPTEVTSYRLPNYGPVFDVRVPDLSANTAWAVDILLRQPRVRQQGFPPPGQAQPATVNRTALTGDAAVAVPPPPPPAFIDPALVSNPTADELYTAAVKAAIIDTMVENSQSLRLPAGEWLTIVAHTTAEPDPQSPSSQTDISIVKFQIKGSDLAEYHAGTLSPEEVRRRVKVSED